MSEDFNTVVRGKRAGRCQGGIALHFDGADPACPADTQTGIITESGYLDADDLRGLQNRAALRNHGFNPIDFNLDQFMDSVRDDSWESKELKQRMAHLTLHTGKLLPTQNQEKVTTIINIVNELRKSGVNDQNFPYLFIFSYNH